MTFRDNSQARSVTLSRLSGVLERLERLADSGAWAGESPWALARIASGEPDELLDADEALAELPWAIRRARVDAEQLAELARQAEALLAEL